MHFDAGLTMTGYTVVKVLSWNDSAWSYPDRRAELTAEVGGSPRPN